MINKCDNLKYTEYDDETLKYLQNLELMILKDFIKICNENNLTYYMYAGSLLGAIRHNGFIPWDDDLDVVMFREDFEKFKKIFNSNEKYTLLTNESEPNYFYFFAKLMLNGTVFEENWISQVNFRIGVNIDIFVLDDLAESKFKRFYQLRKSFFYSKLLNMSQIKLNDLPLFSKIISHSIHDILKLFRVKTSSIYTNCLRFLKRYPGNSKYVFDISATAEEYPLVFSKSDFYPPTSIKFEDILVNVPKNYDEILKNLYGDYMELPPKEKRYNHPIDNLDFGSYAKK